MAATVPCPNGRELTESRCREADTWRNYLTGLVPPNPIVVQSWTTDAPPYQCSTQVGVRVSDGTGPHGGTFIFNTYPDPSGERHTTSEFHMICEGDQGNQIVVTN